MILGISGHPRGVGTALALLREALQEAEKSGSETVFISVHEYSVTPCEGWEWCSRGEGCVIPDDMWKVYPLLARCDGLILATPVYFAGPTGVLKGWIDRCNPFWKDRRILQRNLRPTRPGALIATAGSGHDRAFKGILEIANALFYSLGMKLATQLLIGGLDALQEMSPTEDHRRDARQLGKLMAELEQSVEKGVGLDYPWWDRKPDRDRRPC